MSSVSKSWRISKGWATFGGISTFLLTAYIHDRERLKLSQERILSLAEKLGNQKVSVWTWQPRQLTVVLWPEARHLDAIKEKDEKDENKDKVKNEANYQTGLMRQYFIDHVRPILNAGSVEYRVLFVDDRNQIDDLARDIKFDHNISDTRLLAALPPVRTETLTNGILAFGSSSFDAVTQDLQKYSKFELPIIMLPLNDATTFWRRVVKFFQRADQFEPMTRAALAAVLNESVVSCTASPSLQQFALPTNLSEEIERAFENERYALHRTLPSFISRRFVTLFSFVQEQVSSAFATKPCVIAYTEAAKYEE